MRVVRATKMVRIWTFDGEFAIDFDLGDRRAVCVFICDCAILGFDFAGRRRGLFS